MSWSRLASNPKASCLRRGIRLVGVLGEDCMDKFSNRFQALSGE